MKKIYSIAILIDKICVCVPMILMRLIHQEKNEIMKLLWNFTQWFKVRCIDRNRAYFLMNAGDKNKRRHE